MQRLPYRLRAGVRNASGIVTDPGLDVIVIASDDAEAILSARNYPVPNFDNSDFAWLCDENGRIVWSLEI